MRGEINVVESGERVNDYQILEGEDLQDVNDVVVELHYATMHNVKPGDKITLYIKGKPLKFEVSGICFHPKYIYMFSREGTFEEDYGVFFILKDSNEKRVNTYYVMLSEDFKYKHASAIIESFFKNLGVNALVQSRTKLFAYNAAIEDIKRLNLLANLFTMILLATSAVILFVVLYRLVEKDRREIGTLRANGILKMECIPLLLVNFIYNADNWYNLFYSYKLWNSTVHIGILHS